VHEKLLPSTYRIKCKPLFFTSINIANDILYSFLLFQGGNGVTVDNTEMILLSAVIGTV